MLKFHIPEPSVTSAVVYEVFVPVSNDSHAVLPPPPTKSLITKSSKFTRAVVPSVFRISKRIVPVILTVKEAEDNVVEDVVIVEPVCVHVLPLLIEYHNCHVEFASVPYFAWFTVTTPAPSVRSNFIVTLPLLRVRILFVPFFGSLADVPTNASSKLHTPEPNVTSAIAYAVFVPASKSSETVIFFSEAF